MKKTVKVALCGLSFYSENKGCAALAYSFLELLNGIAKDQFDIELTIISNLPDDKTLKVTEYTSIKKIEYYEFHPYKIQTVFECIKALNRCDCIFDFTEGDSFTDIYGTKRLISVAFLKYLCIFSKACYILGPQTYGPFKSKKSKIIAACI